MAGGCGCFRVRMVRALWVVLLSLLGCTGVSAWGAGPGVKPGDVYAQAVDSPLRSDADRTADATRHPLEFLGFTQVRPGMRVLDVAAGGGYTTQLLALVVGPDGKVWAQTDRMRPALIQRLQDHLQTNVIPALKPYDDPVPEGARNLDLVTIIMNYHDIAYMPVDRAKMDQRLFEALKHGGHLVLVDHSSKPGAGTTVTKSLHRIDEETVKQEFLQAGFRLDGESDYLRNPKDPRDQPYFKAGLATDKFALRFVKP